MPRRYRRVLLLLLVLTLLGICGCVAAPSQEHKAHTGPIKIGLSLETLKLERWQRDRDLFVQRAHELGAEVLVQTADSDDAVQTEQAENLITQGVDVLVVVPHNGQIAAAIVENAKRSGVPVIAYDRPINNADVDYYASFDGVKVGELQAKYLTDRAPKGNYILIGGAPTDPNALTFREGQMRVLAPFVSSGRIKIVADQWAKEWLPSEALRHTENALTQSGNNVVAVLASNDGTAGGAIEALQEQGLAGKVLVSGQDADLPALRRIVAGTQSMTVYKPLRPLATHAAEAAVLLAQGKTPQTNAAMNNGVKNVPAMLVTPIALDKSNIDMVFADGFARREDVFTDAR